MGAVKSFILRVPEGFNPALQGLQQIALSTNSLDY